MLTIKKGSRKKEVFYNLKNKKLFLVYKIETIMECMCMEINQEKTALSGMQLFMLILLTVSTIIFIASFTQ